MIFEVFVMGIVGFFVFIIFMDHCCFGVVASVGSLVDTSVTVVWFVTLTVYRVT